MTGAPPPRGGTLERILRKRRRTRNLLLVLFFGVVGAGSYWLGERETTLVPPPPQRAEHPVQIEEPMWEDVLDAVAESPVPATGVESVPVVEPLPDVTAAPPPRALPRLDESDDQVRTWLGSISQHAKLATLIAGQDLVRRFVVSVDNIAEGKSPRDHLDELWPAERFKTKQIEDRNLADPVSHARYDVATQIFLSIDPRTAADLYDEMRPLIDRAYADLGYPEGGFDDTLLAAINELLTTPLIIGEPKLVPRIISWEYEDDELEGLSDAQKQFLRMGPSNVSRIQKKLRIFAEILGTHREALATTSVYRVDADRGAEGS